MSAYEEFIGLSLLCQSFTHRNPDDALSCYQRGTFSHETITDWVKSKISRELQARAFELN